jgi:hypothetical protein
MRPDLDSGLDFALMKVYWAREQYMVFRRILLCITPIQRIDQPGADGEVVKAED